MFGGSQWAVGSSYSLDPMFPDIIWIIKEAYGALKAFRYRSSFFESSAFVTQLHRRVAPLWSKAFPTHFSSSPRDSLLSIHCYHGIALFPSELTLLVVPKPALDRFLQWIFKSGTFRPKLRFTRRSIQEVPIDTVDGKRIAMQFFSNSVGLQV